MRHPADAPNAEDNTGTNTDPTGRYFTLAGIARLLDLSVSHLRREVRLRRIAVHRFGRLIRVSEADLADYLARRRRGAR
jgi:excisionase family DNA binding protein